MTDKKAAALLSQNLQAIYGYAYSKLYHKEQAEDLASEIVYEIMISAHKLQNEDAFWGFAWKIAENTTRRFLRKNALISNCVELTEENMGVYDFSPEQAYIEKETEMEEIQLLRCELSLLKKTHREVCVAYYIDNKDCSQIAKEQNMSVEMVKYHLFKTRKVLKEGFGMTRLFGVKSYNPGTFRLDFWGDKNKYSKLFERKLPGSIVLAAYDQPLTAEELAIELGVAMPYLEEEIEILEAAGILKKMGEKYRTNIVILTDAYENEFVKNTASVYANIANDVFAKTIALLPQIRKLSFNGNDYEDNRLLFGILNLIFFKGYDLANKKSPLEKWKKLALGGHGFIYGYDNDYIHHHYHGIIMKAPNQKETAWFSVENYRVIQTAQLYEFSDFYCKTAAMCDAILHKEANKDNPALQWLIENRFISCKNHHLSANFLVFEKSIFCKLSSILSEPIETVANCMMDISDKAETMLAKYTPTPVREQCRDIAKVHHRMDVAAFLMEELIKSNKLTVPDEKMPLCLWGVIE